MRTQDILIKSIEQRKPISFEYNKPGKPIGERIGNVHAIFIMTRKDGSISKKIHIVQTAGVSDSKKGKPFPDFRMFDLDQIGNVKILDSMPVFDIDDKYNPEWEGYDNSIALI